MDEPRLCKIYRSEVGDLLLVEESGFLTQLHLPNSFTVSENELKDTPLLCETAKQLDEYFCGRRKKFDLPLKLKGTTFQNKVWQALTIIGYGQCVSYKDIARQVGAMRAYRAVGSANHRNPIPIIIPCHRVIASSGALGGYGGGLELKTKLLDLEQRYGNKKTLTEVKVFSLITILVTL